MIPVVIDTDGGVDDAMALWWALTDPRVDVVGILATWGNVPLDIAAGTCARILAAAERPDIPIALGMSSALGSAPLHRFAPEVHGHDGLGGHAHLWPTGGIVPVGESATELLARLTDERPGEVVLVTLGPLSTTAAALREEPGIASRVRSVAVMGGSVRAGGNALPAAEANIAHDPLAAAEVLAAGWPSPPLLVGLDVTHEAVLRQRHIDLAAEGRTIAGKMLADPLRFYADFCRRVARGDRSEFPCHDLLAAIAAVDAEVIQHAPTVSLAVDTGGSAGWGATVADLRPRPEDIADGFHPCRVALDVDAARFEAEAARMLGG